MVPAIKDARALAQLFPYHCSSRQSASTSSSLSSKRTLSQKKETTWEEVPVPTTLFLEACVVLSKDGRCAGLKSLPWIQDRTNVFGWNG